MKASPLKLVQFTPEFSHNIWQDHGILVISPHSIFPTRCLQCSECTEIDPVPKLLFWHPPIVLPLLLISWPFYIVTAVLLRKHLKVDIPLCQKHIRLRMIGTLVGFLLLPTFIWMGLVAIHLVQPLLILLGLLSTLLGVLLLGWVRNPIWAVRMMGDYVFVKGVDPKLMEICDFPNWVEPEDHE